MKRIEIHQGAAGIRTFPLDKPTLSIGSGKYCDIVIIEDHVSRKHLLISVNGDDIFIEDLGSSNGTYINDERLEPNVRQPLTTYFPLRLGINVIVKLVDDTELSRENQSSITQTRIVSPKELRRTRTMDVLKKSRSKAAGNPMWLGMSLASAVIFGAYISWKPSPENSSKIPPVQLHHQATPPTTTVASSVEATVKLHLAEEKCAGVLDNNCVLESEGTRYYYVDATPFIAKSSALKAQTESRLRIALAHLVKTDFGSSRVSKTQGPLVLTFYYPSDASRNPLFIFQTTMLQLERLQFFLTPERLKLFDARPDESSRFLLNFGAMKYF